MATAPAIEWTRDAMLAVTSQDAAKAVIRKAAQDFKASQTKHGTATVHAAYATDLAVRNDILVIGRGAKADPDKGQETQAQFGQRFLNFTGDGVSQSTVQLWVLLGSALMNVGIEPDTDVFKHLAFKGGATKKPVADAIRGDDREKRGDTPHAEWVEKVLRCFVKPDGKTVPEKDRKKALHDLGLGPAPVETESGDEADGGGSGQGAQTAIAQCTAAIGTLAKFLGDVSVDDFATIPVDDVNKVGKALASLIRERKAQEKAAAEVA